MTNATMMMMIMTILGKSPMPKNWWSKVSERDVRFPSELSDIPITGRTRSLTSAWTSAPR